MKTAIVTGILGQDGAYLADHLLEKGYKVVGVSRRRVTEANTDRLRYLGIADKITIEQGDVCDLSSIYSVLRCYPDTVHFYNLAAQSFVGASWKEASVTSQVNALGVLNCLEACRLANPEIRFYQASTSEMFGNSIDALALNETSPFMPRSPYGVAKLYGHHITKNYRESYDMFACSGILFNHESPLRGVEFVTQKIVNGAVRIKAGIQERLKLGQDTYRDWGHAADYVRAMVLMLEDSRPNDYVVATGECHSISDFCALTFAQLELDYGMYTDFDDYNHTRPAELFKLIGNPSAIETHLGWKRQYTLGSMIEQMISTELLRPTLR